MVTEARRIMTFSALKKDLGDIKSLEKALVGECIISNVSKTKLDFHGDLHWTTPSGRPPKSECSE